MADRPTVPAEGEKGQGWQGIETAPREGLVIGALIRRGEVWRVFDMECARWGGWYTRNGNSVPAPTHWMPLPQPPQPDRGGEER